MKALVLNLPLPPSVNKLFANAPGKGRVRTKAYRRWSVAALNYAWLSKPAGGGFPEFEGEFSVQIAVPMKMRGDVDNRIKPILDWLKKPAGIIVDDRYAQGASIVRAEDVEPNFCRVFVFDARAAA